MINSKLLLPAVLLCVTGCQPQSSNYDEVSGDIAPDEKSTSPSFTSSPQGSSQNKSNPRSSDSNESEGQTNLRCEGERYIHSPDNIRLQEGRLVTISESLENSTADTASGQAAGSFEQTPDSYKGKFKAADANEYYVSIDRASGDIVIAKKIATGAGMSIDFVGKCSLLQTRF